MEKLVCDRCGQEYADAESVEAAKRQAESWKKLCERDGAKARGVAPCPNISCKGELVLKTY